MAVRIRLKKTGNKNNSSFRIVVIPQLSGRDSRTIEELGYYDPRRSDECVNIEKFDKWISEGAIPTDTVNAIVNRARKGEGKTLAQHKEVVAAREAKMPTKVRARKVVATPEAEVATPEAVAE